MPRRNSTIMQGTPGMFDAPAQEPEAQVAREKKVKKAAADPKALKEDLKAAREVLKNADKALKDSEKNIKVVRATATKAVKEAEKVVKDAGASGAKTVLAAEKESARLLKERDKQAKVVAGIQEKIDKASA